MATRRKPVRSRSLAEQIIAANAGYTQRELAAKLGVSERTIRRWKSGQVTAPRRVDVVKRVNIVAAHVRGSVTRKNVNRGVIRPISTVPVVGHRRSLIVRDAKGNDTGRRKASDWVNYDVRKFGVREALSILLELKERGARVQLFFSGPKTVDYPAGRHATEPIELDPEMSDQELLDLIDERLPDGIYTKIQGIGVRDV